MEMNDSCCLLDGGFDQFSNMDLHSSADCEYGFISDMDQGGDQLSSVINSLDFNLDSQKEVGETVDSFPAFDTTTFDRDFGNQLLYDDSPSSCDSGNYSPVCSTSEDLSVLENEQTNASHSVPVAPVPDPGRLIPVQVPIQKIVSNSSNNISKPMICIMPSATNCNYMKNIPAAVLGPTRNVMSALRTTDVQYVSCGEPVRATSAEQRVSLSAESLDEFNRKKEDRKIRNRYSAQLSRIRKRNEFENMKRNLANKEMIIHKLRAEIDVLKTTVEILRKENETLKMGANKRNSGGRVGVVAGTTCLFAVISLFSFSNIYTRNLDPNQESTGFVPLDTMKPHIYSSKFSVHTGRALLSYDYEGSTEYSSSEKSHIFSQPALNNTANCSNFQKYLNHTEAMRLNDDVFAWVNRHECLQFMHIRRIFRVPLYSAWKNQSMSVKSVITVTNKKRKKEARRRRTALDKMEDARIKAARERVWRHIDMISTNGDSSAMKPKLKTVDYAVADRRLPMHFMDSLLKRKTDNTLASLNMESQYVELARNLRQREDTLYVVAMKDYYLLPPSDRNDTMQPRVALILPALSFNGTLPNQVPMMRLECYITGTGLFHLPSSLLPLFYEQSSQQ